MRRPRPLLALVGLLALTACGGGDDVPAAADGPATSPATSAPADTTTTLPPTPAPTTPAPTAPPTSPAPTEPPTTPAPTEPPTTAPAQADGDCLVGSWVVTESELNGYYDAVEALIDQPIDFTIVGSAGLEFTDTTYAWSPDFTLELELNGITGTGQAGGSITGTYTTDGEVLTTELGESAMTLEVEVAGQRLDGSDIGNGFITSVPFVDSPYSCDGPVIMFETIDDRHPVTLTPAG